MRSLVAGLCLIMLIAGCSTLGVPPAPDASRLDVAHDDVAALLIAVDLPRGIGVTDNGATAKLAFTVPGQRPRMITAALEPTDPQDLAARLPPPANGRAYYFFGFAEKDRASIRGAQGAGGAGLEASLTVVPSLCASGPLDPAVETLSVRLALAARARLAPLVAGQRLSDFLVPTGAASLPQCE